VTSQSGEESAASPAWRSSLSDKHLVARQFLATRSHAAHHETLTAAPSPCRTQPAGVRCCPIGLSG
jgi:hypothetical protein